MDKELRLREEPVAEMSQCLEEMPVCKTPTEPCESEEQRDERRKIEFLKNWEIIIQVLDRGCVVRVGCKSIAFVSVEVGYKEIGRYLENPQLVATQYGLGKHL